MIQILDRPGVKEQLGAALGTGVSTGLRSLLDMKMRDIERQRRATGLQSLGLPGTLAALGPQELTPVLKYLSQQREMEEYKKMAGAPSAGIGEGMPSGALPTQIQPGAAPQPAESEQVELARIASMPKVMRDAAIKSHYEKKRFVHQTHLETRKEINKNVAPKIKSNQELISNLNEFRKAITEPKAYKGPIKALINKVGLEDVITSPETQLGEKISANMLIKEISGVKGLSRVTDFIIKQLAKSLPSMVLTEEGGLMIADLKELEALKAMTVDNEAIKIAKEHENAGLAAPVDWKEMGAERAIPKIKRLETEYNQKFGKRLYNNYMKYKPRFRAKVKSGGIKDGTIFTTKEGTDMIVRNKALMPVNMGEE